MVRSFVHWEEAGKSFARLKKLEVNVFMGAGIGVRGWMSEFVDLTK